MVGGNALELSAQIDQCDLEHLHELLGPLALMGAVGKHRLSGGKAQKCGGVFAPLLKAASGWLTDRMHSPKPTGSAADTAAMTCWRLVQVAQLKRLTA